MQARYFLASGLYTNKLQNEISVPSGKYRLHLAVLRIGLKAARLLPNEGLFAIANRPFLNYGSSCLGGLDKVS